MKMIIIGAGRIGRELIKRLQAEWNITVIDEDPNKLKQAIDVISEFERIVLLQGDGTSKLTLKRAKVSECKVFVACTGDDEVNLESCRLAKEFNVPSIYSVSNLSESERLFKKEGISYVNKATATASVLEKRIESGIILPSNIGLGMGEIAEVTVMPTSIIAGYKVGKFSTKRWKIAAIFRNGKLIMPYRDTVVKPGDRVLIIGEPKILKHIIGLIRTGEPRFPLQFGTEEFAAITEKREERIYGEVAYIYKNTNLRKIDVYHCFKDAHRIAEDLGNVTVNYVYASSCKSEILQKAADKNIGISVLPNSYSGFPLYFGFKTLPIKIAELSLAPTVISRGTYPYRNILVPVSGSFSGFRALEVGIELSLMLKASLSAVFIRESGKDEKNIEQKVNRFAKLYKTNINFISLGGNPIRQIKRLSKSSNLLIIGARKGKGTNWFKPYAPYHMFHESACTSMLICVGE